MTLFRPSWNNGVIPICIARSLISEMLALAFMSSLISSLTNKSSNMPTCPLYPRLLHFAHPFGLYSFLISLGTSTLLFGDSTDKAFFISSSVSFDTSYSSLQWGQSFLTNLCDIIIFKLDAITSFSISNSINRAIVPAASLVCNVEKTKCPVRDACMAILAVSLSLISPTIITSGSCLKMDFSPLWKSYPCFSLTWVWLIPFIWYSIGSSIVIIFVPGFDFSFNNE